MIYISLADISTAVIVDSSQRAVFVLTFYARDFVGIYPRVTCDDTFFLVFLQYTLYGMVYFLAVFLSKLYHFDKIIAIISQPISLVLQNSKIYIIIFKRMRPLRVGLGDPYMVCS